MNCPHVHLEAALDRWTECHWHIHQMEKHYHSPDPFRFSLNSFIRTIKEVPQILQMELQNHALYKSYFKPAIASTRTNPLINLLHNKRNFIVHQGMLDLKSTGIVGTTEGRGRIKLALGFDLSPSESTQDAYLRFKELCKNNSSFRSMLGPDCDSWPIIRREWKIPDLPDKELLEVSIEAWREIGNLLSNIIKHLGGEELDLTFSCRHDPDKVRSVEFSQEEFFQSVDGDATA